MKRGLTLIIVLLFSLFLLVGCDEESDEPEDLQDLEEEQLNDLEVFYAEGDLDLNVEKNIAGEATERTIGSNRHYTIIDRAV